jgi:hypothetical protein
MSISAVKILLWQVKEVIIGGIEKLRSSFGNCQIP